MLTDETQPVRNRHRFDEPALADALRPHVDGTNGPVTVLQMAGGQSNPTFLLCFEDRELVLRKQPPGRLLPSAHAIDREYRVLSALHATPVPVPEPLWYCEDASVIGTPFYVMERMHGRIFRENELPGLQADERAAVYDAMNATLAKLHCVDADAIGLGDYGKAGNYFERQFGRLSRQYAKSHGAPNPGLDRLVRWLPDNIPAGEEQRICHGDFRLENLMFAADTPEVIAVFDWELSTLGHPLADLGYNLIPYHMEHGLFGGLRKLDLPALGIPSRDEYVASYERRGGPTGVAPFHVAFACFRGAVILEGVAARARAGNAASDTAGEIGSASVLFSDLACELLDLRG